MFTEKLKQINRGKYVKAVEEFIIEAAEWDDTTKRYIDKKFERNRPLILIF